MLVEMVTIDENGNVALPDRLRDRLKGSGELVVLWNDEFILLKKASPSQPPQSDASKEEKIGHLFEISDLLAKLNEIAPLSEAEIQAEIAEVKTQRAAGHGA